MPVCAYRAHVTPPRLCVVLLLCVSLVDVKRSSSHTYPSPSTITITFSVQRDRRAAAYLLVVQIHSLLKSTSMSTSEEGRRPNLNVLAAVYALLFALDLVITFAVNVVTSGRNKVGRFHELDGEITRAHWASLYS